MKKYDYNTWKDFHTFLNILVTKTGFIYTQGAFSYQPYGISFFWNLSSIVQKDIMNYLASLQLADYFEFLEKSKSFNLFFKKKYQTEKAKRNFITLLKLKGIL